MNIESSRQKTKRLTAVAFLAALIVVLQVLTYFIKAGPFNMSFVLIPIVLGGMLYGPGAGAFLGGVFGVVVVVVSVMGLDVGGNMVFAANPFLCILLCVGKGVAAGWVPAVVYKALNGKINHIAAIVIAAALAPICNTGIFIIGMLIFFRDVLSVWSGGTDLLLYVITGIAGINFIVEFLLNVVVAPILVPPVEHAVKKSH